MLSVYRTYFPEGKLIRKYWLAEAGCVLWLVLAFAFLFFQAMGYSAR